MPRRRITCSGSGRVLGRRTWFGIKFFQGDFSMVISWNLMRLFVEPSTTLCVSRIVPVSEFWYSSWTLKPTKSLYSFGNALVIWKYMFIKQFPRVVWSRIRIWIATWICIGWNLMPVGAPGMEWSFVGCWWALYFWRYRSVTPYRAIPKCTEFLDSQSFK